MKNLAPVLSLVFTILGTSTKAASDLCSTNDDASLRIVDGIPAKRNDYPPMVSISIGMNPTLVEASVPATPSNQTANQTAPPPTVKFTHYQNFCGGVVIRSNWVLTAAHCLQNIIKPENKKKREKARVLAGFVDITPGKPLESGEEVHEIKAMIIHPEYKKCMAFCNDVGLVRIKGRFNKTRQRAVLSTSSKPLKGWLFMSEHRWR